MQLKVQRNGNHKTARLSWRRRLLCVAIFTSVIGAAVAIYYASGSILVAARSLREFIADSRYFAVHEIQVRSGDKVSGNEIVAIAGLKEGVNIWTVDPVGIEKKLAGHPWVRRVLVRREFPRRIVIDVEQRQPKAIVATRRLYYVDADGVIFKEVMAGEDVQFPLLTGLRAEQLMAPDPTVRRKIQEAVRLGDLMAQRSHLLSEIHFDAPDRLSVYTTNLPVALHMGWGDWEEKLGRMERLLSLWKNHEQRLASLDMSYRNQVVARLRQAPQQ